MALVPPAARHLRAAAGRRPDDPRQDPAGPDGRAPGCAPSPTSPSAGRAASATSPRARTCSSTSCRSRTSRAALDHLADGRPDDARGVRQLGAQHHRLPLRRRLTPTRPFDVTPYGEALTRYFLAPSAEQRRCRASSRSPSRAAPRITPTRRSTTSAGAACDQRDGVARLPRARRRRHRDDDAQRRSCSSRSSRSSEMFNVAEAIVRVYHRHRRLPAQAEEPDEVPDQVDRVGSLRGGVRRASWPQFRAEGGAPLPFDPAEPAGREPRRTGRGPTPPSVARRRRARRRAAGSARARASCPDVQPDPAPSAALIRRWRATNVLPQKQAGYALVTATIRSAT